MKFFNKILAIVMFVMLLLFLAMPASAQFDYFAKPRIAMIVPTQAVNAGSSSNFCIDTHGYFGAASVILSTITNGACSAGTLQIYTSPDRTNWSGLTGYSLSNSNQVIYTNVIVIPTNSAGQPSGIGPGPQLATNLILYPGVKTTPTAALNQFATSYISDSTVTFTNTGSITLSNATQNVGFIIQDQQRYIQFFYSFTGASTNTISATLICAKQQD